MDILKLLRKDHDEIRELFAKLENMDNDNVADVEDTFSELRSALINHAKAEEFSLYARIEEVGETRKYALEGLQEHDVTEYLLSKLYGMPIDDWENWNASVKVLKEVVEHHLHQEEKVVFKAVKKEFSLVEREEMAIKFQDQKHSQLVSAPKLTKYKVYEEFKSQI
ncbi:MAG: hemerythrin domain-containing protein [Oligoflexia bacterium]|nr:hemerythrin domain-containing protein [Oligoflexia bacterium]